MKQKRIAALFTAFIVMFTQIVPAFADEIILMDEPVQSGSAVETETAESEELSAADREDGSVPEDQFSIENIDVVDSDKGLSEMNGQDFAQEKKIISWQWKLPSSDAQNPEIAFNSEQSIWQFHFVVSEISADSLPEIAALLPQSLDALIEGAEGLQNVEILKWNLEETGEELQLSGTDGAVFYCTAELEEGYSIKDIKAAIFLEEDSALTEDITSNEKETENETDSNEIADESGVQEDEANTETEEKLQN